MANVYIVRAEDTRLISDGGGGWISVPDIKLPAGSWTAYEVPGQPAFHLRLTHKGRELWSCWHGPHVVGTQKLFIVTMQDDADKGILLKLRRALGGSANAMPLIRALRAKPALRRWIKKQPWLRPIKNSAGRIVGVRAPLVIAGHGGGDDVDGDDVETSEILTDLEG